jgi:hypothetical protein
MIPNAVLPPAVIASIPGNECLGRGYDVFGTYASPVSTTEQLFELGEETTSVRLGTDSYLGYAKNVASYLKIDRTNLETIFGETIEDYLRDNKIDL